jgi:hypothetical protein
MILRLEGNLVIDNLRNYPPETVAKLRALLAAGAPATPDPHRKNFYDLENREHVFYIHVCPSGRVLFLASWLKQRAETPAPEPEMAVLTCP